MSIYLSDYLKNTDRGKTVAKELKEILGDGMWKEIPNNNKNEWCRDYMPVKGSEGQLVLFKYLPAYIVGRATLEKTIPDQKAICDNLGLKYEQSNVILDGGAIEIFDDIGIVSDRVISDNCSSWLNLRPSVLIEIKELLKLSMLIVVPSDPWDFTGHVDGMVRFINKSTVLINDSSSLDKVIKNCTAREQEKYTIWKTNFHSSLENAGLKIEILPCAVSLNENDKDSDAKGIYLNFLLLEDKIIMPSYKDLPEYNKAAQIRIEQLYQPREVYPIEASLLAKEGGIINCITWTD